MSELPAKLVCKSLWKIFGTGAEAFLNSNPSPDEKALRSAGLIGAVRDINLSVHDGEIFVIMSRLIEPTAGQILFDGQDLLSADTRTMVDIRRHKMGMVFQHFALLPHLTVLGNVAFPLEVQGMERGRREVRAREVIELVGLEGREDYYPRELSGGQQQRVGIARSLAVEPELWFLDEPFSALDPLIRREMQDEFMRIQSVLRKTIVFITHDFDEAIRLADRVAIMKDGIIDQIGTPEQLVMQPATDYVAKFTRDVSRAKVLSAGAIMTPLPANTSQQVFAGEVRAATKIIDIAETLKDAAKPFAVIDENNQKIGVLSREDVFDVLVKS